MANKQIIEVTGQLSNHQQFHTLENLKNNPSKLVSLNIKMSLTSKQGELFKNKYFVEMQKMESTSQNSSLFEILEMANSLTSLEFKGQGQFNSDFIFKLCELIGNINTIQNLTIIFDDELENSSILPFINVALKNKHYLKTLDVAYNIKNNQGNQEQMREFAQLLERSKRLSQLNINIKDESIPQESFQNLVDVIKNHQSINKIGISLNEEFNVLFLDYIITKPQNIWLEIRNHKLISQTLIIQPDQVSNQYLFNLTQQFNSNYSFLNLSSLKIIFPKLNIIEDKNEYLDLFSESIQNSVQLREFELIIKENFCKNLTWVANIFNNLTNLNCLEQLILKIESNNTFNQLELNESLIQLQQLYTLKNLSIFIKNQKQELFCFFILRHLQNLQKIIISNQEIQILHDKNLQSTLLKLNHVNVCQNSQIEQFINQNRDLKNIQIESENQNFLSLIYLSIITNNQIKYQTFVSELAISKCQKFLFYNLDINLTSEISENGIKALCNGIVDNIPKLEKFKIKFQRELQNNEILYLSHIFKVKKEISIIDISFKVKNYDSIGQFSQQMIDDISQNQVLKQLKLEIEGASSLAFLALISKCKNLEKINLNLNEISLLKQLNHQAQQKVISLEMILFQLLSPKEANQLADQIEQFKDLEKLKIVAQSFNGIETLFIQSITKLLYLKDLEIKSKDQLIDDFILYSLLSEHPFLTKDQLKIKPSQQLNYQKQDQSLDIYIQDPCENIDSQQKLVSLLKCFSSIKTFKLKINIYENTSELVQRFSQSLINLQNLNTLEIQTKNKIDHQTISTLLSKITNLNNLKYFQLQYFNNEGIDSINLEKLNLVVKTLTNLQTFNLQLTTSSQVFNFGIISKNLNIDPIQLNTTQKNLSCDISIVSRENQRQDFYNIYENNQSKSIFNGLNITTLNINLSQKSQIFDTLFSFNCFEDLVFLQNLSISVNEYSINEEQLSILTKNISSLQNIQKLSLNIKQLTRFSQQNIFEIGESIRKSQDSIQFIEITIENQIEYQDAQQLILSVQDASQLEELSLNFNLLHTKFNEQDPHFQNKKSYFRNENLKKFRSFTLQVEGQAQNICQLIYQIIAYQQQLSYLKISIGQDSGISQYDVNYLNKAFLTLQNLQALIIQIQQQKQLTDIFICNLQELLYLKYLTIAIDQSNTSQNTIRCLNQELKKLKNINQFNCLIDHPYSLRFLELINQIQNIQINQICKFKHQQFEINYEEQGIIKYECLLDTLNKCRKQQLKCAIQKCQPDQIINKDEEINMVIKELFVELVPTKDIYQEYQIDGLTHAIQQFDQLQHIHLVFNQNFAINNHNGLCIKEMFKKITFLIEVRLTMPTIDKDGCKQIGQGLGYLYFLLSLNIQIGNNNQIGDEGIKNLLKPFNNYSELKSLSLVIGSNNLINEKGVQTICEVLITQKELLNELLLDIKQYNNIGEGVKHLKDTLCQMQELLQLTLELDFNNNDIINHYPILDSIKELTQLKNLSINIIGLDKQKRKEFIFHIKQFQILAYFEFQTKIYYKETKESALLQQKIQNNTSLKAIKYPFINLQYHILPIKLIEIDCRLQK